MKPKHKQAYMQTAEVFANCSNDDKIKVGCVVVKENRVVGCGYNGLARHVEGSTRDEHGLTRPEVNHAEKNALMGLLRAGISPVGAELFVTLSCCKQCAIDVVDAGIKKVYYRDTYKDTAGIAYLEANGIEVERMQNAI